MTESTIADIVKDKPDSTGAMIRDVYTKIEKIYAVYRTDDRVMIQFADDQILGADQRKSLADLYVTRGQINSMLDDLRASGDQSRIAAATRFERRLADALIIGLQGQGLQALTELESLKKDLIDERNSRARLMYLLSAFGVGLVMISLIGLITSPIFNYRPDKDVETLWFAGAVGIVGAFFSIAIAIRNRSIESDRITRDTIIDAVLRIQVGALAGALMFTIVKVGAFSLKIGDANIAKSDHLLLRGTDWLLVLLVAFVAGFFERMVPDLLTKATPAETASGQSPLRKPPAAEAAANERNPLGNAAGNPGGEIATPPKQGAAPEGPAKPADKDVLRDPDIGEDDCCNRSGAATSTTDDVQLPGALGGVEGDNGGQ